MKPPPPSRPSARDNVTNPSSPAGSTSHTYQGVFGFDFDTGVVGVTGIDGTGGGTGAEGSVPTLGGPPACAGKGGTTTGGTTTGATTAGMKSTFAFTAS